MNSGIYWPVWLVAFALLVLLAGVEQAEARTVRVCAGSHCTTITLPKKGKCIYRTIRGYRVRVCR